jgi:pilus assembly protein CpaB
VRLQTILALVLALVFGGSAAAGVNLYLKSLGRAEKVDTVPVVVAAADVPRGGTLTADVIATRDFPRAIAPAGALSKPEEAIDRVVALPLVGGEPVLEAKLSPKGAGRGLAALVPKGMRAVTIHTPNVAAGVAGFVQPGNKVDVLLTVTDQVAGMETGGGTTMTLLQSVEILAVDQKMDAPADNRVDPKDLRSVTLLVTPHEANLLDLGQVRGTLHLSLRNHGDDQQTDVRPATLADLRFRQERPWDERVRGVLQEFGKALAQRAAAAPPPAPVKAPVPPPKLTIRTIRGAYDGRVEVERPAGGPAAE